MARINVVLPHPFVPSSAVREPVGRVNAALESSFFSPAFSASLRTSTAFRAGMGVRAPRAMRISMSSRGRSRTSSRSSRDSIWRRALCSCWEI